MATYEYVCLACEHHFEQRRPMASGGVDTALACPSCGAERIRRRFSFSTVLGGTPEASGGGCGCGNCTCGAG
jgi:putative FmdB family regulatory protein